MRAAAAALAVCMVAAPADAKPRRFQPAAIYAGMFHLHHAWRYRIDYASRNPDRHDTQHYTIRCSVTRVRAAADAIVSEIVCTHGPEEDEGLWQYHFLPGGTWVADADGLSRLDDSGGFPDAIPALGERGSRWIDASPAELSTPAAAEGAATHVDERRVGHRWCVPGEVGGSDEGPATQEVCFGASGVPETGVATGTAPEKLTFELAH